jgi:hypothetical protein
MTRAIWVLAFLGGCASERAPSTRSSERPIAAASATTTEAPVVAATATSSPATSAGAEAPSRIEGLVGDWLATRAPRRNEALLARMLRVVPAGELPSLIAALETPGFGGRMDDATRVDMETAIVEAIGRLDEPSALPVLRTAFTDGRAEAVRTVAARGLARRCGDSDLALLLDHARAGDPLEPSAVDALGDCLRRESAERLASLLEREPGDAGVARALGRLGSSLVWSAPSRRGDPAGDEIRLVAARALARAVARVDAPEARRGLAIVRHPSTDALLDEARQTLGGNP